MTAMTIRMSRETTAITSQDGRAFDTPSATYMLTISSLSAIGSRYAPSSVLQAKAFCEVPVDGVAGAGDDERKKSSPSVAVHQQPKNDRNENYTTERNKVGKLTATLV